MNGLRILFCGLFLALGWAQGSVACGVLDCTITTRDGQAIHLGADRGKWVLVNYWATWCGACRDEAPALAQLAAVPALVVIGFSDEQISAAAWQAFLTAHPVPYQVALVDRRTLPDAIPPAAYMLEMRPISYLIAPDGRIAKRFLGEVTKSAVMSEMH